MEENSSSIVNNICTILGGALLLFPLIDQATKTLLPEMQKLASGQGLEQLKLSSPDKESDEQREEKEPSKKESEDKEKQEKIENKRYEC